jgi:hypothetical protein
MISRHNERNRNENVFKWPPCSTDAQLSSAPINIQRYRNSKYLLYVSYLKRSFLRPSTGLYLSVTLFCTLHALHGASFIPPCMYCKYNTSGLWSEWRASSPFVRSIANKDAIWRIKNTKLFEVAVDYRWNHELWIHWIPTRWVLSTQIVCGGAIVGNVTSVPAEKLSCVYTTTRW